MDKHADNLAVITAVVSSVPELCRTREVVHTRTGCPAVGGGDASTDPSQVRKFSRLGWSVDRLVSVLLQLLEADHVQSCVFCRL